MELLNLLNNADVAIGVFGQTYDVYLNWIGKIIRFLITSVGTVGVGIILFSLVLKLIVLPFDVYQRISMRKQNLTMKANQERMEKLQKQYANNKELYNQKVMEMYKENGMSMMSSCLPMILSLVIFIVAINAFNAYSQYSNIENYNLMVNAYNAKMEYYCADLNADNLTFEGSVFTVKDKTNPEKYLYYTLSVGENEEIGDSVEEQIAYLSTKNNTQKSYYIDKEKAYANPNILAYVNAAVENAKTEYESSVIVQDSAQESVLDSVVEEVEAPVFTEEMKKEAENVALKTYFTSQAQDAVVVEYNEKVSKNTGFLWIKNIWVTDASYKHPVLEYSAFKTEVQREDFHVDGSKVSFADATKLTDAYKKATYDLVTGKLEAQKNTANGYYVLVLLSIGTILLQQFVTMRSQKEQQQLATVDGQGASQQKMMMVMMTGMFAIFSFMYSSAFSIYMITSNLFSLMSTLIINKAVDTSIAKKEAEKEQAKYNQRFPGRNKDFKSAEKTDKNKKK